MQQIRTVEDLRASGMERMPTAEGLHPAPTLFGSGLQELRDSEKSFGCVTVSRAEAACVGVTCHWEFATGQG
jgi:hypothetical protein